MLTDSKALISYDNDVLAASCHSPGGIDNIGDIVVNDSSNIHIGTRHVFNGNVTIKQYAGPLVHENSVDVGDENCVVVDRASKLYVREGVVTCSKVKAKRQLLSLRVLWIALVCVGLIGAGSAILLFKQTKKIVEEDFFLPANVYENETDYSNQTIFDGLKIVTRTEWSAASPTKGLHGPFKPQKLPIKKVIIGHTVTNFCNTLSACSIIVKAIQSQQLKRFGDIAYNFLVGGDGNAYFGLGWNLVGTHTFGFNTGNLGVAFIGKFTDVAPNESQINATLMLMDLGVKLGKIDQDYKVYAQCQLTQSLSPGKYLYERMFSWPHFDNGTECIF